MAPRLDQMIIGAGEADVVRGGANNAGHNVEILHGHS